jgi:hypothetical protein
MLCCNGCPNLLLVKIPTRAATIYHFAWLRNRIANIFGRGVDHDLDDIKDWYGMQIDKNGTQDDETPPPLPWSLIWGRGKNDVENR